MEELAVVLREVRRQGGFEYAKLARRASGGADRLAAEQAHDMAWEQLHCAPWHTVHSAWRDAFALSSLQLAAFCHSDDVHGALRLLDMGLLMGGPLLKSRLHSAIADAQQRIYKEGNKSIIVHDCHDNVPAQDHGDSDDCAESRDDHHEGFRQDADTVESDNVHANDCYYDYHMQRFSNGTSHCSYNPVFRGGVRCSEFQDIEAAAYKLPHLSFGSQHVERQELTPVEDFLCNNYIPGIPLIIENAMSQWPAMKKWKSLDYFMRVVGNRTVPIEVGEHYLASGWKQELMTMVELLKKLQGSESSPKERPYLAQHPLFEQIPELREDIAVPDYIAATGGELRVINAWFGPQETVTPLHHDPHHNLLSQVVGRKYVRLYPPAASDRLYPYNEAMLSNSSQVNLDNPDYKKYPLSENLPFLDCVLQEGEMLYVPPKWWHYVRSLSLSFSVSFWWSDSED